ncbi:MAG: hydrolase 2, exosortase A system-associated [Gammaproteobacteria bacterium]
MTLAGIAVEPFFLPADHGLRFCLLTPPRVGKQVRGAILHVQPFAEEMNKSRRMVALTARALAESGWAVLQLDLLGCGDSSGDLGDATWAAWLDDIARGYRWLETKYRVRPVLWGLRLGGLLVTQCLAKLGAQPDLILWQPVISGHLHLGQFLRMRVAGEILGDAETRTDTKLLRKQLAAGDTIEIAGYALAPTLAEPMAAAALDLSDGYSGHVSWYEIGSVPGASLAPASQAKIAAWRDRGIKIDATAIEGLPFWQTQVIAECPALVVATVQATMAVRG